MKPDIWGPHAWIFLHSITLDYPDNPTENDKKNFSAFFNSLGYVLPCTKCKLNFKTHLEKYPLTNNALSSKTKLIKWLIDIHNEINKINNKPIMSYETSLQNILTLYESEDKKWIMVCISLIFLVLCILFFLFNIYR